MSGGRKDVVQAEAAALLAKAQVRETVARLRLRLDPRVRANEVLDGARRKGESVADDAIEFADDAIEFAYEHHRLLAGVAGAGLLVIVRKPLVSLFARLRRPRRSKWDTPDQTIRRTARVGSEITGSKGDIK